MTPFGQALRALALNCEQAHIFHPFGVTSTYNNNNYRPMEYGMCSLEMGFLCDLFENKITSLFGHPTQVSTQVQLAAAREY